MRMVKAPERVEPWRVVCAAQSEPNYSEDRQILLYGGDWDAYHNGGPFVLLDGDHCSCYDWEEVEWYATEYTRDEILRLAKSKTDGDGCYSKSERTFWKMVLYALVARDYDKPDSWEKIEADAKRWMYENGTTNGVMRLIERCKALAGGL